MKYLALLRGINVGGNRSVSMAALRQTLEGLGFAQVSTYINSGNVIFETDPTDRVELVQKIKSAIAADFGFTVKVLLRSHDELKDLVEAIPQNWVNDQTMKCDVIFLDSSIDNPQVLDQLPPPKPEIEDIIYTKGAVVWRIDRANVTKTRMFKLIGTPIFQQMTVRNPNTVRKLYQLMLK